MNNAANWFSGLATLSGFLYFLLGFGSAYVVHCAKMKMRHKKVRIPWHLAGIAIGTAAILIVTLQSSIAYNLANETADEVQACQREFNQTLRARSKIAEENDRLSVVQRTALGDWLRALLFPPADIANLRESNPNDPRVQTWSFAITRHYSDIIEKAQREQAVNFEERRHHPLPDPTCGAT